MSYLCSIIELIQNMGAEDADANDVLKEIEEINKKNKTCENQLEELDREHVRLQIELYNLETITSHHDSIDFENYQQTFLKMFKDSVEIKYLIDNIDFTKILQCYHMEMETKCRKEWQPIQECFVKTIKWHEKMEKRQIVQNYYQAELALREAEADNKNQLASMKKSFKQSLELISQAKEKRNELIVNLVRGGKEFELLKEKLEKLEEYRVYIEALRQEKLQVANRLEQRQLKAFNPMLSLNSTQLNCNENSKSIAETCNYLMPELPSFNDILKSFNQPDKITIENTTNICVKSILHTSSFNQSITTKQTKNVRFKMQLEEYHEVEEFKQKLYISETESEIDTDIENDVVPTQLPMETNEFSKEKENLQGKTDLEKSDDMEIVDLLTPAESVKEPNEEKLEVMDSSDSVPNAYEQTVKKPLIDIQDCIIFKTPFPIQEISKIQETENVLNITASCSKQFTNSYSSLTSSNEDIKELLNSNNKSFYGKFLNVSSSSESSPKTQGDKNPSLQKDFATFLNDKEFSLAFKESNEENVSKDITEKTSTPELQEEVFDFGSNKGFTFDSDDNMLDNYNKGSMDFL